jgi:hypothetical protein
MRVHTSSTGLDPRGLAPGRDIVLALDETHGLELPEGAFAQDHLDMDARREVDAAIPGAFAAWREECDAAFTVDGVCLPWIWEQHVHLYFLIPAIGDAVALVRAAQEHGAERLELADADPRTALVARAAAAAAGVEVVSRSARAAAERPGFLGDRPLPAATRLRRRAMGAATRFGFPTLLRDRSVLFLAYWPTVPLLDRLLEGHELRPAVSLQSLPPGPSRSLRAALRGGWVGKPGVRDRAAAERAVESMLARVGPAPEVRAMGVDVGPALHTQMLDLARHRAAGYLANVALFRRAFAKGRVRRLVVPFDLEPHARLVISLAREAGVPSLLVGHGAYVLPRTATDMEVSDEIALWSRRVAPPFHENGRRVHEVGFPLEASPPPTRTWGANGAGAPTVVVLGQGDDPYTTLIDARIRMRHYCTAVAEVSSRLPHARIVLRPHPSDPLEPLAAVQGRFPEARVEVDSTSDIAELMRACDLCIGAASTATFQAALEGAPVVVLNLTGFEWGWPLGGDTSVPVARSAADLGELVQRFATGATLPGRDDLLSAIGADRPGTTDRLLGLLAAS